MRKKNKALLELKKQIGQMRRNWINPDEAIVFNWFVKSDLENIIGEKIPLKLYKEFHRWCMGDLSCADALSGQIRTAWFQFTGEKEAKNE